MIARTSTVCHTFDFAGATATHHCKLPMSSVQLQELQFSVLHQHEGLHQSSQEEPFLRLGNEAIADPVVERAWSRADPSTALPNLCETPNCSWLGLCSRASPHE